jgi:UDP-2-acetamido-3-amino-2,3-dideoxy-glucuronate N-acetyltransferase
MSFFKVFQLPEFVDSRGILSFCEYGSDLPFIPKRCFWIHGVPGDVIRGEHAHKECEQYLICLHGSVKVLLDDGNITQEIILNRPNLALYIPPLTWGVQFDYSADSLLLVLASLCYDKNEYITDYDEFLRGRSLL